MRPSSPPAAPPAQPWPRPKVVVSKCLGFAPCRYNGQVISDDFVAMLAPLVEFLPVCPEVEMGLGVPRESVRLVEQDGQVRVLQPRTGLDHTPAMADFCARFLASLGRVEGFLLKGRSPSCGPVDVKIYSSLLPGASCRRGAGAFAAAAALAHPGAAVEHEGRARNFALREHFLTKLYTRARFTQVLAAGTMRALVSFQSSHKLLLLAYSEKAMRELGRLTANPQRLPVAQVLAAYGAGLDQALARNARRGGHANVLLHAMGYFKRELAPGEKRLFLDMLAEYQAGRLPLVALLSLVRGWIARWGQVYLAGQVYFAPYPPALMDLGDSGKGRDL